MRAEVEEVEAVGSSLYGKKNHVLEQGKTPESQVEVEREVKRLALSFWLYLSSYSSLSHTQYLSYLLDRMQLLVHSLSSAVLAQTRTIHPHMMIDYCGAVPSS